MFNQSNFPDIMKILCFHVKFLGALTKLLGRLCEQRSINISEFFESAEHSLLAIGKG